MSPAVALRSRARRGWQAGAQPCAMQYFEAMPTKTAWLMCLASSLLIAGVATPQPATPAQLYAELFERVQLAEVYRDSKTFVDALPKLPPDRVLAEYRRLRERDD